MIQVSIAGDDTLRLKLRRIEEGLRSDEAQGVFMSVARAVRDAARRSAPVKSGALKKAIVAAGISRATLYRLGPAAFSRVNLFKGTVRAPHGHLVEFGTRRGVRPRYFFRRAVDQVAPLAVDGALAAVERIILRRAG